jgi:peptide/nickel transport system permease protein
MTTYLLRRLLLLPLTLFGIILVNFIIINLAPGDPTTVTEITEQGAASRQENRSIAFSLDDRYLQFREHYGLTLPVLWNTWPQLSLANIQGKLWSLVHRRETTESTQEMSIKAFDRLRIRLGDQARFVMPRLLAIAQEATQEPAVRRMASRFFARGATRQAFVGANLTAQQRLENRQISQSNEQALSYVFEKSDTEAQQQRKIEGMQAWFAQYSTALELVPTRWQQVRIFFLETRFFRYLSRVLTLDFGTLRNDPTKRVIDEVVSRFKYSLTLAVIPLFLTFFLCLFFGYLMAYWQTRWPDLGLNVLFLVLYAVPVFVVAPLLIETVGQGGHFLFTSIPIPISGFTSPESVYERLTSWERLVDILQHLYLPLIAIIYGSLAVQSRLARTAVLEVLHQDYIRTAKAKGVPPSQILYKHVGRNAAITLVTSIAGSLGIVLGGSLIVETLFDIHGFGKFFYDAVVNWDYNVIMFSALAGSLLTLVGYLIADIAYTLLDPRLTLE